MRHCGDPLGGGVTAPPKDLNEDNNKVLFKNLYHFPE